MHARYRHAGVLLRYLVRVKWPNLGQVGQSGQMKLKSQQGDFVLSEYRVVTLAEQEARRLGLNDRQIANLTPAQVRKLATQASAATNA